MRQIIFDGRIGKDGAKVLETRNGKKYARFSVANDYFSNGERKTDWFDVTSYDPYVIENRVEYLTKGTYVIITGSINSEVSVKNNNVWLNNYVTATNIDTPSLKKNDDNTQNKATIGEGASTYTASTQTTVAAKVEQPAQITPIPSSSPTTNVTPAPQPAPAFAGNTDPFKAANSMSDSDDDMPF